jgi:hypothetical protein
LPGGQTLDSGDVGRIDLTDSREQLEKSGGNGMNIIIEDAAVNYIAAKGGTAFVHYTKQG